MTTGNLVTISDTDAWKQYTGGVYRCQVFLSKLDDGTYLAVASQMPDVSARGTTEAEALANVASALVAVIPQRRTETGVPWITPPDTPLSGAVVRWVFVDTRNAS